MVISLAAGVGLRATHAAEQAEAQTDAQAGAEQAPPPPSRHGEPAGPRPSGEALRSRLAQRLESVRAMEARLESAIADLDAGRQVDAQEPPPEFGRGPGGERRGAWRGMRDDRRPGDNREPVSREPMTAERRAAVLAELDTLAPRMAEAVRKIVAERPIRADAMLSRIEGRLKELRRVRAEDPEAAEIKADEFRVGLSIAHHFGEYRRTLAEFGADAEATVNAKRELRIVVAQGLELKLQLQELEIERLERKVADLKRKLAEQRADPERLIDERLEQMTDPVRAESRRRRQP